VGEIGAAQGQLRAAYLKYHLTMLDVLTVDQVKRYAVLRGYTGNGVQDHTPGRHRHGHK
jgi:hypothetical protein